ncbi:MAG: ATP-binding cassette domain-containing protein [Chloroflexaceae bacterium]|jgi:ABC-2 type transport system ATP-binding protein|nr:ATP-binding cassette domain-containing protein [Chloroflexaceae bacterium]
MAMIETVELSKTFASRSGEVAAVRGVTMQVQAGEIFGFLGPNGAGKTTTMRMLATLLVPSSGSAMVAGCDLRREPGRVRQCIGYVGQQGGAEGAASGQENLVLQGRLYGLSHGAAQARGRELAATLELESFVARPVRSYSGGQRRRLDLALGMVHRPALLFLDEPTTGLDPQSRARLWDEVRKLRDGGTTVFLTTHYLDEADALCDRLAIMDGGQLVSEGTPGELKRQVAGDVLTLGLSEGEHRQWAEALLRPQPYLRELHHTADGLHLQVERGEETLPLVLRTLDSAGITIRSVTLARPSLDDVFLRLTGRSLREEGA